MDRNKANDVITEVEAAVDGVLKRHGLILRARGKYTSEGITVTLELKETAGGGGASLALIRACAMYGFDHTKTFESNGRTHRLIDYNDRATKTPFITEAHVTGYPASEKKRYRWSADMLRFKAHRIQAQVAA